jgi:hypothetical protein
MRRDVFFNSEERVWVVFSRQEREQLLQRHSAFCLSGFAYLLPHLDVFGWVSDPTVEMDYT